LDKVGQTCQVRDLDHQPMNDPERYLQLPHFLTYTFSMNKTICRLRHLGTTIFFTLAWGLVSQPVHALDVRFEKVVDGVYAYIGETGARSIDNEGLNANIGLVLTTSGAVLIDSGATYASARKIHEAARQVTAQPIRWVINTGGQDHRWLGNQYFAEQGAQIIAHAKSRSDMENRGADHLAALRQVLGDLTQGTQPMLASVWLEKPDESMVLDGVRFEMKHRGGAHTPGDILVYLPQKRVVFSGDVVYVTRMLGVIPVSHTRNWLATFEALETLSATHIVPGHGGVTTLAQAQADTKNYLVRLRAHMKKAVDEGQDISEAVRSFSADEFKHLLNAKDLMPGNASRTYLELERE
jgi:glyoxylase-like metal-dependent hydrolase (beta-lactamase superfamily II)